jgi:di/tricarboxylate transporter
MPLAFCSALGLFTLISTTPNLVIQDVIIANGFEPLSFFSFAPIGAIALSVGLVCLFFLSKLLVKNDGSNKKSNSTETLAQLAERYHLKNQSYKLAVGNSPLNGKTLAELKIATNYNIHVNKISHKPANLFSKNRTDVVAGPNSMFSDGDILFCQGESENVHKFAEENNLTILKEHTREAFSHNESGIAEIYVLPISTFVNRTIAELQFRKKHKVNVLGIQRGGKRLEENIKDIQLKAGDAILVQGTWADLAALSAERSDFILAGQPLEEAAKVTLDKKAPIAAIIMLLMILSMVFDILTPAIAVLTAAVAMVLTGCLRNVEEAYAGINWQSIVLIAAMMPMVTAFNNTGLTPAIANLLTETTGAMGPYALLIGVYLSTSLLTMVISNTATAILFAPIAIKSAILMGVSPYPFMFAVAVAATMSFASPFSTPPNAIVMAAGRYSFMDYIKVGLPLQIIMALVMFFMLPILYPF